jgi:hypothetical protein
MGREQHCPPEQDPQCGIRIKREEIQTSVEDQHDDEQDDVGKDEQDDDKDGENGHTRLGRAERVREDIRESDQIELEDEDKEEGEAGLAGEELFHGSAEPSDEEHTHWDREQDEVSQQSTEPISFEVTPTGVGNLVSYTKKGR